MTIHEVVTSGQCEPLYNDIQSFVEKSLAEYNDFLENGKSEYSDKDIFDLVWGTVEISEAEILVLDSPIIQRLRGIHHLGMADVVFCNATSSRFSHTIGVVEVSGRMAKVVNKCLNEKDDRYIEAVRMAAIFHDAGHMAFSHVSEAFFEYNDTFPKYNMVTEAIEYFSEKTQAEVALHELLSVMIVNSPETRRLFKNISRHMNSWKMNTADEVDLFIEYVSGMIVGVPIDSKILPYSQIINGSVDADKLDYLLRDSECTKVPIAVDVARIIQKLSVTKVDITLDSEVWQDEIKESGSYNILALKNSAKKVFFQLSNARSSMFDSVYYHHKVLTAETMFREALFSIFENVNPDNISFSDILSWQDDIFNEYWKWLPLKINENNNEAADIVSKQMIKLKKRELYKRVAAFSRDFLEGTEASKNIFVRSIIQQPMSEKCKEFFEDVIKEYEFICKLLNKDISSKPYFTFASSKHIPMQPAPIEYAGECCIWSSKLLKQETVETGKKSKMEQFYFLSDCKERVIAYLAFEKVLWSRKLKLAQDSSICLKVTLQQIRQIKKELMQKNYYNDSMVLIDNGLLRELIGNGEIKNILAKYKQYQGPNGCKIDETRLYEFMRQFLLVKMTYTEAKNLFRGVARLLNKGVFINRELIRDSLNDLFDDMKQSELPSQVVLLGNSKDSASHLAYYFNDIKYKVDTSSSLEKILEEKKMPGIIGFFDDGAYSGKQIVSIFQEYMGVREELRATDEKHVDELSNELKEKLKNTHIIIMFILFNEDNRKEILNALHDLGLMNVEIINKMNMSNKVFDDESFFESVEQKEIVEKVSREIGLSIVNSTKSGHSSWNEERIQAAALGYNDAQQIVVTETSVPTYTITLFWMSGQYKNKEWKGLFERTIK